MQDILKSNFIKEIGDTSANMYRLGWNERNGGNISYMLTKEEVEPYCDLNKTIRKLPLDVAFPELASKYFLVTGTGKYFKNISDDPEKNLGLIRISDDGTFSHLLWGFSDGGTYTSEIHMHLGAHMQRLKTDPNQRVVVHAHPTNIVSMTHIFPWDEREFTRTLWQMCTECIVIFPEGVAVLPWMVSSNAKIGMASAEKFKDFRILVWALHGCTATGDSLDEAFGLLETVEKGAEIYMNIVGKGERYGIDDEMLKGVVEAFNIKIRDGWL